MRAAVAFIGGDVIDGERRRRVVVDDRADTLAIVNSVAGEVDEEGFVGFVDGVAVNRGGEVRGRLAGEDGHRILDRVVIGWVVSGVVSSLVVHDDVSGRCSWN